MPIYAYKCGSCGHAKDVLQKMSDAPLTICPSCGAEAFSKQVTAASFRLKGTGWYVTDFRDGGKPAQEDSGAGATAEDSKSEAPATPAPAAAPAPAPAKTPAPAPAASTGSGTATG